MMGALPLDTMSPREYAKDIKVPIMYVQARNDQWTELSDILSIYDNTPDNPKEFVWIENTKHRYETYSYFQDKPDMILAWAEKMDVTTNSFRGFVRRYNRMPRASPGCSRRGGR